MFYCFRRITSLLFAILMSRLVRELNIWSDSEKKESDKVFFGIRDESLCGGASENRYS